MPLYEYKCDGCQAVTEFHMKMSDPDPKVCPNCGKDALSKILSTTAFHLKGGGWYSEGYDGRSNKSSEKSSQTKSSSKDSNQESSKSSSESKAKSSDK